MIRCSVQLSARSLNTHRHVIPVEAFALTHAGLQRERNEDAFACREDLGLFVVADGMGGHAAGDVASRVAVEAFVEGIARARVHAGGNYGVAVLRAGATDAHEQIRKLGEGTSGRRPGTTVVCLYIDCGTAWVAHVGDSRAYRLRGGRLERLTRDHSHVQRLIDAGDLVQEDAESHPLANVITHCLGYGEIGEVFRPRAESIMDGDVHLLASDGLTRVVREETIAGALAQTGSAREAVELLVELALEAGGPDNITVAVVRHG